MTRKREALNYASSGSTPIQPVNELKDLTEQELDMRERELQSKRSIIQTAEGVIRTERQRRKDLKRSEAAKFISDNKATILLLLGHLNADTRTIKFIEEEDYWDSSYTLHIETVSDNY